MREPEWTSREARALEQLRRMHVFGESRCVIDYMHSPVQLRRVRDFLRGEGVKIKRAAIHERGVSVELVP